MAWGPRAASSYPHPSLVHSFCLEELFLNLWGG